jgi:hypothetical protein
MNIATQTRALTGICFKIHNPQVAMAYQDQPFLRSNLLVRTADNFTTIVLKLLIFYLVCGRINTSSTVPMYWSVKIDRSLRKQLAIAFRPVQRRKFKFGKYDRNIQLHIPHYNGDQAPKIPGYTVGQYSAKVILKDQSSILVHAESEAESEMVVRALLHYVEADFIPKELVIHHSKRSGKALSLTGQKVRAFKADYYPPATQTPEWSIQL